MNTNKMMKIMIAVVAVVVIAMIGLIIFLVNNKNGKDYAEMVKQDNEQKQAQEDAESEVENTFTSYTVWTTDGINFREDASADASIISTIPNRTELIVTNEKEGWLEVSYNGQTGYISKLYTTTEEPVNNGYVICIDPGHQASGDSTQEANGPGSSVMKARVTGGTHGTTTGVYEYELNLTIGLALKTELENRGYTVYMTRTSHDVNISNKERAEYATSVGADITVRIHANGSDDSSISGALTMAPSTSNPYVSNIATSSQTLAQDIIDAYCNATGMANQGVSITDTMTGINWCTMPVTIIEMGYMTNPSDDTNMEDAAFQQNMVYGIANGIDAYFGN